MTLITKLLYEVDINELRQLPMGIQVLKQGAHGGYFVQQAGIDLTESPCARYFLFNAPPLLEVNRL